MSCRLLSRILAASAAFATAWAPMPAAAGITTPTVIANTVAAVPSCLSYKVEGICFFLYCSWKSGCRIRTSIKISHYVPDVVVSTYNSPQTHPWKDVGVPVSSGLAKAGSTLLGSLSDSSAGGLDADSAMTVFKGADAIGNPAGRFAELLASGGMFQLPRTIAVPGVTELSGFPSELPSIGRAWASVPSEIVKRSEIKKRGEAR